MAITTIESKNKDNYLIWKHPNRNLSMGSQIIVNESEEALLFENGQLLHILQAGKHKISSGNIPGLDGIIRRSVGNTPIIKIDTWFVNKVVSTDYKWGIQLQVKDNLHQLLVPVGSYGSILLKIEDPASFVIQVVGKNERLKKEELKNFILPCVERGLKEYIAEKIKEGILDVFNIESVLGKASNNVKDSLKGVFEKYGLTVVEFFVQGIQVQGESPEYKKIKESLADAASLKIRSKAASEADATSLKIRAKAASEAKQYYKDQKDLDVLNKSLEEVQNQTKAINKAIDTKPNEKQSENKQGGGNLKDKLEYLRELLDSGLITKAEYDKKRFKLLDQI